MSNGPTNEQGRQFEFDATEAVMRSRANASYVPCPACGSDAERYLFHERGARFVQCRLCRVVYVNPPTREVRDYFSVDRGDERARDHVRKEIDDLLHCAEAAFEHRTGSPARRILLVGRTLDEEPRRTGPTLVTTLRLTKDETAGLLNDADVSPLTAAITDDTDIVVLNQVLEACTRASDVVEGLAAAIPDKALVAVAFSNVGSLPGRVLRRNWRRFFDWKSVYFDSENLRSLMERKGFRFVAQQGLRTSYSLARAIERTAPGSPGLAVVERLSMAGAPIRVPTGTYVAVFEPSDRLTEGDVLSVIVPVYNEAAYVRAVLEALLDKQFAIPHEIIVVESNSTDGTREIVRSFEGRSGIHVVYEDRPRGKGGAVRRGLSLATGSIVLIQDADFEYDLDDYDALLEPIVQRRTSFVLGSRSLGLDDWKVRRLASSRFRAFLMNFAQLVFAKTFNVLFQQRVTDVNTMFKVFRRECLDGLELTADGFSFDIELACMLVKSGFSPMEVPVNYVARGFDEGKKIHFTREFFPSYSMFFRCRFGRRGVR